MRLNRNNFVTRPSSNPEGGFLIYAIIDIIKNNGNI